MHVRFRVMHVSTSVCSRLQIFFSPADEVYVEYATHTICHPAFALDESSVQAKPIAC